MSENVIFCYSGTGNCLDMAKTIARELGVPVKFIGVGEGIDDLRPFVPAEFAAALFEGQEL